MLEQFLENVFPVTAIAQSKKEARFEFFEIFLFRIKTHISFQFIPNKVLDGMSLMERSKRDVHELVSLFLVNRDRKFAIQIKWVTFVYEKIHIFESVAPIILVDLNSFS